LVLGIMNTVLTESSMESTDLPRPVASSAYSGIRFLGGAMAPPVASALGQSFGWSWAYVFGAGALVVALVLFFALRGPLSAANKAHPAQSEDDQALESAEALIGDAS